MQLVKVKLNDNLKIRYYVTDVELQINKLQALVKQLNFKKASPEILSKLSTGLK